MPTRSRIERLVFMVLLLHPVGGCAAFEARERAILYSAYLGPESEVEVFRETKQNATLAGPMHNYSKAVLRLTDAQRPLIEAEIARVDAPIGQSHLPSWHLAH